MAWFAFNRSGIQLCSRNNHYYVRTATIYWIPTTYHELSICECLCAKLLQSCLTLCDPVNCSPPGPSIHGLLQGRIPEWVAMPFSKGCLISLLPKGLSRIFSSTTIPKHQFFGPQPSYGPILISIYDYWKNHSFDQMDLCWQSDISAFNILSRFAVAFLPRSKYLLI